MMGSLQLFREIKGTFSDESKGLIRRNYEEFRDLISRFSVKFIENGENLVLEAEELDEIRKFASDFRLEFLQKESKAVEEDVKPDDDDDEKILKELEASGAKIRILPADSDEFSGFLEDKNKRKRKNYEAFKSAEFKCGLCSFSSKRKSHLDAHIRKHESSNSVVLECDRCDYKCIRKSTLAKHKVSHSENLLECPQCSYATSDQTQFRKHRKYKHLNNERRQGQKPVRVYECSYCDYKTLRALFYLRHSRKHDDNSKVHSDRRKTVVNRNKEVIFGCPECQYETRKKDNLKRHILSLHTKERKYLCDFCGVGFKRRDTLKSHLPTHADQMTDPSQMASLLKCEICGKVLRNKTHLNEHLASSHSDARDFLCHVCGAAFKTKSIQMKHYRTVHEKQPLINDLNTQEDEEEEDEEEGGEGAVIYTLDLQEGDQIQSPNETELQTYLINESGQLILTTTTNDHH